MLSLAARFQAGDGPRSDRFYSEAHGAKHLIMNEPETLP